MPLGLKKKDGSYQFNLVVNGEVITAVLLNMGGMHNVENAIAAITVAHQLDIDQQKIKNAVASFRGVKRRFEYIIRNASEIFIDDYAHHPEELKALIGSAKALFPAMRCTVIFQPHLYSRTKDLAEGFAESLDMADEVILLPIYPARELPVEGVTSEMILNKMKNSNKKVMTKELLLDWIKNERMELVITAGAGDIDALVAPIKEALEARY